MRTRPTQRGGSRTRVALLALALSACLLVAAFGPGAVLAGTVTSVTNHEGNTTPTPTPDGGNTTPTPTATPTPTPVPTTTVSECRTIDSSGDYRLAADLSTDSGDCLEITAGDVTLDGDGHVLSGGSDAAALAITAGPEGETRNVVVRDLTARRSGHGVLVSGSEDTDDVTGIELVGITGHDNSGAGIRTVFANATIEQGTLTQNGVGAEVLGGAAVVEATDARRNQEAGLKVSVDATALTVTGGSFTDNLARGLLIRDVDRATITGATVTANGFDGVTVESTAPNTTLRNLAVTDNDRHGVVVRAAGVHVLGSTASRNGGDGFRLPALDGSRDARRLVAGTSALEARNNGDAGARLAGSNTTVLGLVATGNRDGLDLTDATGVTVSDADPTDDINGASASSNTRHGVLLSNTTGSAVEETQVQRNDDVGIRVQASDGNTLAGVTVNGNGETFNATGGGTTTVERMTISSAELSFAASDVAFGSTVPPANARPGSRTFGPYLDASTTTGTGGGLGGVTGDDGDGGFLDLTVHYPPASVSDPPLVRSTARIQAYDGAWSTVDGSSNDADARTVSANISNPATTYAPAADLENAITACGYSDWRDGETYRVDADLSGSGDCLEVAASDSTLVGFGFGGERDRTLSGSGGSDAVGIALPDGETNVTVEGLTVEDFGTGVTVGAGTSGVPAGHTLRGMTVAGSAGDGIAISGDAVTVADTLTRDNGGDGIAVESAQGVSVEDSAVLGNGGAGLNLTGDTALTTATHLNLFVAEGDGFRNVNVSFDSATEVRFSPVPDPQPTGDGLEGTTDYVDISPNADDASVDVTISYTPASVSDESALSLYSYDEGAGEYVRVEGAETDEAGNVVTAGLDSFSTFAPLVETSGDGTATPTPGDGDDGTATPTPGDGDDGTATPTPGDGDGGTATPTPGGGDGSDGTDGDDGTDGGDGSDGTDSGSTSPDDFGAGGGGGGGGGGAGPPEESPSFATTAADVNRTTMRVGGTVAIDATVRNSGDGGGTYEVDLFRGGDFVQSRFVELVPGERERITFHRTPSTPGSYTFRAENVTAGTVNVTAPDEDATTPTGTPTDTPTRTTDRSDGDDPNDTGTGDGDGTGDSTPDGESPAPGEQGTSDEVSAPRSPDDPGGDFGGLGPLGMVFGGVGALAVGAGAIYLLVLKP
ncbi:beta strand repeat-containing protein [Haloglomus litoreum]|uniref:beta strand repeat-containing protein n=1 Tax=Haloglomus litoreum TaxID=3034026 RepID=UPI0023E89FF9|nr:right-handed parallel beta-helix repeat-containing protein [Haloglomus sp. DT116]